MSFKSILNRTYVSLICRYLGMGDTIYHCFRCKKEFKKEELYDRRGDLSCGVCYEKVILQKIIPMMFGKKNLFRPVSALFEFRNDPSSYIMAYILNSALERMETSNIPPTAPHYDVELQFPADMDAAAVQAVQDRFPHLVRSAPAPIRPPTVTLDPTTVDQAAQHLVARLCAGVTDCIEQYSVPIIDIDGMRHLRPLLQATTAEFATLCRILDLPCPDAPGLFPAGSMEAAVGAVVSDCSLQVHRNIVSVTDKMRPE